MDRSSRPIPEPITPESRPYWEGLRVHKLMLPNCVMCGPFFYPRILCPRCHASDVGWIEASGRGRVYAFEIVYQAFNPAFKIEPPYVLAMIELEEGPRIMSNLIDVSPDPQHVHCDMAVEVVFERLTEEVTIPLFRPVERLAGRHGGSASPASA